ncbi:RNase_T domain-containing protein [Cephalotus follicularis]|uniref:RNase_T domain-containing protein n=1 Tax=Cephalotus follicularis TaxID=3775 RepID=A0A1Q3DFG8_CEPFO|nr:RNase_T domain-containing protein [Cephalotus follicularis]
MSMGFPCHFILQVPKCRIQSSLCLQSANVGSLSKNYPTLRHCDNYFGFKLLGLNKPSQGMGTRILPPISTTSGQRTKDGTSSEPSNGRSGFSYGSVKASTVTNSHSRCFHRIQYGDAQSKIFESKNSKPLVRVFVFDLETSGLCKEERRIIEIAIRDLSGGKNSCFQTLVNPEQDVPNSRIHGITTDMVNRPDVPRMVDLIPILVRYIESRLMPGELPLFVAHNARRFDVPFLIKEFSRCKIDIPSNWLFLDTLPLARELMKLNGSKLSSLEALRDHFEIPIEGSSHRAMSDVNLLSSIFGRMTIVMKLTVNDLMERDSFKAADSGNLKKNTKKSRS